MSTPRSDSIFTRGAVDLSALAARSAAPPEKAPDAPADNTETAAPAFTVAAGTNGAVVQVDEANLQAEVLERSLNTPVIVNFGAAWAEPSTELTPLLVKLNSEDEGAWVLANVDVDATPRIAQMFRVQQVPMVYAIVGGQPLDAFAGKLPEPQLRQWIDAVRKAAGQAVEPPEDPRLIEADELLMSGDLDAAETAYKKILSDSPAEQSAEAGLAQIGLYRRLQGIDPAQALSAADRAPDDVAAQSVAADVEVLSGDAERAYLRLVDLIRRTSGAERDAVRKHLVSLFTIAGPDDPAVATARKALASALF
jgi:putative thioredoxin